VSAKSDHEASRALLAQQLGEMPDRGFLEAIWATLALTAGRQSAANSVFGNFYPPDALNAAIGSRHSIHPWELETLANELLASPKGEITPTLTCTVGFRHWWAMARVVNTLRLVEGEEYGAFCEPGNVRRELTRLAARQFEWQRGFLNVPQLYRSAFLFGGDLCSAHLEQAGISMAEMSAVGFALFSVLLEHPAISGNIDLRLMNVDRGGLNRVLSRIAKPLDELRDLARAERQGWRFTAYRPSILRRFPLVSVGGRKSVFLAPMPDLVLERVTSGIFYDIVGGGGPIRHEYGRRFEEYCWRYMRAQLPNLAAEREWQYQVRKQTYDTPDLLVGPRDRLTIVIECKATKMGARARFDDQADDPKGFKELAKGIYQVWRFFSHSRRGFTGARACDDAVGMILTLDGWLVLSGGMMREVLDLADELAAMDAGIEPEDKKPVIFCQVTDFEITLAEASERSFNLAARTAAEREGWFLSLVHSEVIGSAGTRERKPYPFEDLAELLPWWGFFDEKRKWLRAQVPG
jgi:hypothetical protein